jgi:hypothetical protein
MGVIKFILRIIGWLVTIIFQVAGSFLTTFLFSLIFGWVDIQSRLEWLALLFVVWLSYLIGINLVGQAALRWAWKSDKLLVVQRLIGTAVGAIIPLLILIPIGFSVPMGGESTQYYDLVTNNWQPVMAQASVFAGIIGFYLPGLLKNNKEPVIEE